MSKILLEQKNYEELSQSIFDLNLKIMEKDKEIERLNNIINELEKQLNETYNCRTKLRNQLQQEENIRKEVREYILTHKLYCFKYDEEEIFEITTDKKAKDELLEILDKVSDEQWKKFG